MCFPQISGGDGAGVLYGVETFCQIVQQCGGILPCVQIQDAPDMPNRGYYFDQTRGRVLKLEELKKIADRMCRYKLNQLQLYVEHTYLFRDFSIITASLRGHHRSYLHLRNNSPVHHHAFLQESP